MEYTKLGRTGLDVSRIFLGCMSYGGGNRGPLGSDTPWQPSCRDLPSNWRTPD